MMKKVIKQTDIAIYWLERTNPFFLICPWQGVHFNQSVFGGDVYPSLEEKAANLLYFMIKDHPYADGCKRIAASLFLEFLARNNALYRDDNKIISDGALVAITLMIAESRPEEKDIMVNLVMNFLTM